ncbi:Tim10/DDP family zinc finger protein [Coniochaeta sp. 2T2.1]|nr:Tim10/DDP family zinc finger protein [Coniochaeta sp. 2T2.1]
MDPSVSNLDLEQLNEKDKAELRQFVGNENQRTRVREQTHVLTDICWKKCVTGTVKNAALDKGEQSCLANCVDRFLDVNFMTLKHLGSMRQG